LVLGIAGPLAPNEIQLVLTTVQDVKEVVTDIETAVKGLAKALPIGMYSIKDAINFQISNSQTDVVSTAQTEIQSVLTVVGPLVTPILGLALSVAGTATSAGPVAEILAVAGELKTLASSLLAPVTSILGGALGGVL
jgi:hypothetical protein